MIRFEVNQHHIRERFAQRYDAYRDRSEEIIDRVLNTLRENTPDDWRFTESPTSRFFVMEEETNAKFMGMSYRESPRSRQIVKDIHDNTDNFKYLFDNLKRFVKEYISDVLDPNLPIVHQIRTVYPEKKANIAEEKHLAEAARSAITTHVIPVASKKIASRPNIVVTGDSVLWVRQYMNWLSMKPRSREYYLFHPLKRDGIERNRCAIFVYSESDLDYDTQNAILNLSMLRGDIGMQGKGVVSCSELANKPSLLENGFIPVKNYQKLKSAAIFGEDPLYNNKMEIYEWLNNLEFLLVADSFMTETAKMAHVVLPLNSFIESEGTITNDNNVVQTVTKVCNTVTGKENWYVLKDLLGLDSTLEEISEDVNNGINFDESVEGRYIPSEEETQKIELSFTHKPSVARATIELNATRKKILDFKEKMLGKK